MASPARRPNAVASASRCGAGSRSSLSNSGAQSWCSPANTSSISRLDADRMEYPAARCPLGHVFQQRRLAHTRLAAHHQRLALACADGADQQVEHCSLAAPAQLPRRGRHEPRLRDSPARWQPGVADRQTRVHPWRDAEASRAVSTGHCTSPSSPERRHLMSSSSNETHRPTADHPRLRYRAQRADLARRDPRRPLPVPLVVVTG